jgi:transposase
VLNAKSPLRGSVLPANLHHERAEREASPTAAIIDSQSERTIAWLNRYRRLAKDWENLNRSGLAFLKLASIRLMLRELCNP